MILKVRSIVKCELLNGTYLRKCSLSRLAQFRARVVQSAKLPLCQARTLPNVIALVGSGLGSGGTHPLALSLFAV